MPVAEASARAGEPRNGRPAPPHFCNGVTEDRRAARAGQQPAGTPSQDPPSETGEVSWVGISRWRSYDAGRPAVTADRADHSSNRLERQADQMRAVGARPQTAPRPHAPDKDGLRPTVLALASVAANEGSSAGDRQ